MSSKKNELTTANVEALPAIRDVNEMPMILPNDVGVKELFNLTQESKPIADLTGKKFKISGVIPEMVDVNKYSEKQIKAADFEEGDTGKELVKRLRLTLITDLGSFHSFSITFNKALAKAFNMFGKAYTEQTFSIEAKLRGSGDEAKAYYVMTAI